VHLLNRSPDKAEALALLMGDGVRPGPIAAFGELAPRAGLVVNTTSIGMHGTRFDRLPLDRLPETALVTDLVYVPLETPLLADARARGLRTVDGLGMRLHQAVPGFAAWFGTTPEVTPALRARVEATL
jgi:shikimate dehydrogenase